MVKQVSWTGVFPAVTTQFHADDTAFAIAFPTDDAAPLIQLQTEAAAFLTQFQTDAATPGAVPPGGVVEDDSSGASDVSSRGQNW